MANAWDDGNEDHRQLCICSTADRKLWQPVPPPEGVKLLLKLLSLLLGMVKAQGRGH